MSDLTYFSSVTRISDLEASGFETTALPREHWACGDYVVAQVCEQPSPLFPVELPRGRMVEVFPGDLVVGAFGNRAATLEGVGSWEAISEDGTLTALTAAGLFGRLTSRSSFVPRLLDLTYRGHATRSGQKLTMGEFVTDTVKTPLEVPVVLLVGTSMSAGKTTTGRVIIHQLKNAGLRIAAAKLTGAGRYRDVLSFGDAGADYIFDFVDVGLPSTVCPKPEFKTALTRLLSRIAQTEIDVLVAEAGASPLEPYNGDVAVAEIAPHVRFTVLSASDPYVVVGVQNAFAHQPDLVTGPAANTDAAVALVKKLTGVPALNVRDPRSLPELRAMLSEKLGMAV